MYFSYFSQLSYKIFQQLGQRQRSFWTFKVLCKYEKFRYGFFCMAMQLKQARCTPVKNRWSGVLQSVIWLFVFRPWYWDVPMLFIVGVLWDVQFSFWCVLTDAWYLLGHFQKWFPCGTTISPCLRLICMTYTSTSNPVK